MGGEISKIRTDPSLIRERRVHAYLFRNLITDHDDRTSNFACLSYTIIEEGLVKIFLDQDDRENKLCPIMCDFARSHDRYILL